MTPRDGGPAASDEHGTGATEDAAVGPVVPPGLCDSSGETITAERVWDAAKLLVHQRKYEPNRVLTDEFRWMRVVRTVPEFVEAAIRVLEAKRAAEGGVPAAQNTESVNAETELLRDVTPLTAAPEPAAATTPEPQPPDESPPAAEPEPQPAADVPPAPDEPTPAEAPVAQPSTVEPTPQPLAAEEPTPQRRFAPGPMTTHFLRELRLSGITDAQIARWKLGVQVDPRTIARRLRRGVKSLRTRVLIGNKLGPATTWDALEQLSWLPTQSHDEWPHSFRYKFVEPTPSYKKVVGDDGRTRWEVERDEDGTIECAKYLSPYGIPAPVYFGAPVDAERSVLELLRDPSIPLVWTEGLKKLIALTQCGLLVIGLTGIDNFGDAKRRREHKRKHPHAKRFFWHEDLEPLLKYFAGRRHLILYDHYAHKPDPREPEAAKALAKLLYQAGAAEVQFVAPPSKEQKGCDDYYAHHARRGDAEPDLDVDAAVAYDLDAGKAAVLALLEQAEVLPREERGPRRSRPKAVVTDERQSDAGDEDASDLPKLGLDELPQGVDPETGLAQAHRLARFFGPDLRHDSAHGWMVWDGHVWRRDETAAMQRAMIMSRAIVLHARRQHREAKEELRQERDKEARKELAAELKRLEQFLEFALKQQERKTLKDTLGLACGIEPIATTPGVWDTDLFALNCQNGTVDLRSGERRAHRREDLITRAIDLDYDPSAQAPRFEAFLAEVQPDEKVRGYLQRVAGYAAVGVVRDHVIVVMCGPGSNGKSVFAGAIAHALGPYARAGADSLITRTGDYEPHPADVAACFGARLVLVHEAREGAAFDASQIKKLTGGDMLTAHYMRQDFFDFVPTHTLVMLTNHRTHGDASDAALWRRIQLVPWNVTIAPERVDKTLPERLHAEAPGILVWIVRGAVEWQSRGLAPPKQILDQTASYRATEDIFGQFVAEACVVAAQVQCRGGEIYAAYRVWCEANGLRPKRSNDLSAELQRRGFVREERATGNWYRGIGLPAKREPEEP